MLKKKNASSALSKTHGMHLFAQGVVNQLNVDGRHVPQKGYITDELTDYALAWLDERRDRRRPFFLYLAHKAVHEGHVAAEAAAGHKAHFDARVVPSVAYTDPEIAWVGLTEDEAKKSGAKVGVAKFPWSASGRAIANARDEGFTKLIFDSDTHRMVGGGIVGTGAGDLISELALAIEMGADATDIGKTIHPHPTLGESLGMAAEVAHGSCTDVPPARKK